MSDNPWESPSNPISPPESRPDFKREAASFFNSYKAFDVGGLGAPAPTPGERNRLENSLAHVLQHMWLLGKQSAERDPK